MSDCTKLNHAALAHFDEMLSNFKSVIQKDIRNWRNKNMDVDL
jgi:hypothetical protein